MINNIDKQLEVLENAIDWVNDTESMQGAKSDYATKELKRIRRELKKKKYAFGENPAAAVYGASQMGKSYLISNILSENKKTFTVLDGDNNSYVFLDKINPEGRGREATSLVTRFSTNYSWKDPRFPIRARLLTVVDVILVLCDTYYNDLKLNIDNAAKTQYIDSELEAVLNDNLEETFLQEIISEDDIYDLEDYFKQNFSTKAVNLVHSSFFKKIPTIIKNVKYENWINIFELLWNRNKNISKLFINLVEQLSKINFVSEVYLPMDAVLRSKGTILDVQRLKEIFSRNKGTEENYESHTEVLLFRNDAKNEVSNFPKPHLCALTAELTFSLPKSLKKGKAFLNHTDLLDFPGARNRKGVLESELNETHTAEMLLRGKVSYLFNKYSISEKINILLFCQNHKNVEVQNIVPDLLSRWINNMIGDSVEARDSFINMSKVSPLFVVSTMFNMDLQFDPYNDSIDNVDARNNRWKGRFKTVFNEIFGSKEWLTNWTQASTFFQNIYLLRDFRFSAEGESNLYKGFNEHNEEKEEVDYPDFPNFREELKKSFLEFDFVNNHFTDPEIAWDRATSINEDGTQLIIEGLEQAAKNINPARLEKANNEVKELSNRLVNLLKDNYNSADKEENLNKSISFAGEIQANLDIAFGNDPYFFGPVLQNLMISNSDVYNLYLKKIRGFEKENDLNTTKYLAIKMQVPEIGPTHSFAQNIEYLRKHYELSSIEACQDFFENEKGIKLDELFFGDTTRVKSFAEVLAISLKEYWFENHLSKNQEFFENVFSASGWSNFIEMLSRLYDKLQITNKVSKSIGSHVDGYRNIEEAYEMIADISSEILNKFINTVGVKFYDESNFNDLAKASEHFDGLKVSHEILNYENLDKSIAANLITQMSSLSSLLNENPLPLEVKRLPNVGSYLRWYDYLKSGFVTASGVPNYDPVANGRLGKLIEEYESVIS